MARKDFEVIDKGAKLYIEQGLTYEETAERLGVALATVKTWSAKYGWRKRREAYCQEAQSEREDLRKLRLNLLAQVKESLDPQGIYSLLGLLKEARERDRKERPKEVDIDRPRIFLEDVEFVARVLEEIDPEGLKILARNFERITARYKEVYAQTA